MSIEYYKGYTQHLSGLSGDDVDIHDVRTMDMKPGLFLMKLAGQEGYVLPVCKYINNYRSSVMGGCRVTRDEGEVCQNPCHSYGVYHGEGNDQELELVNLMEHPARLAGGIVCITNLMESTGFKRYTKLDSGNLDDLILNQNVRLFHVFNKKMSDGEVQGLIMTVKTPCVYKVGGLEYHMEFTYNSDGSYRDFNVYITVVE